MQHVMELPPHDTQHRQPVSAPLPFTELQTQHRQPNSSLASQPAHSRSSNGLLQRESWAGNFDANGGVGVDTDTDTATAPEEWAHAKGMSHQLRARAMTVLHSMHGSSSSSTVSSTPHQSPQSQQHISVSHSTDNNRKHHFSSDGPLLLRAWAVLNKLGYFWAPASSVRRCQLCVAMYQACEIQLFAGSSGSVMDRVWRDEVMELAAGMPVPPEHEWMSSSGETCVESKASAATESSVC